MGRRGFGDIDPRNPPSHCNHECLGSDGWYSAILDIAESTGVIFLNSTTCFGTTAFRRDGNGHFVDRECKIIIISIINR